MILLFLWGGNSSSPPNPPTKTHKNIWLYIPWLIHGTNGILTYMKTIKTNTLNIDVPWILQDKITAPVLVNVKQISAMNNISPTWKKHFQTMGIDYDDMKYNIWSTVTWGYVGKKTRPLYETIIPNIVLNPTHPVTWLKAHISSPVWLFRSHPPVFALPEEMGSPWKYHAYTQPFYKKEHICLYPRGDPCNWYIYLHLVAFCCFL